MRARILAVLALLGCSLAVIGQSPKRPIVKASSKVASAGGSKATPKTDVGQLKFVVALFRHGVRAPLPKFAEREDDHSGQPWPRTPSDWQAKNWGDLTRRGTQLARDLGQDYARSYKRDWPGGFKVYLWADVDQRNQDTASALADGFRKEQRVTVIVDHRSAGPDPLFHPFKAHCGIPEPAELDRVVRNINNSWQQWATSKDYYADELNQLYDVLNCIQNPPCKTPLKVVADTAFAWSTGKDRDSPITWTSTTPPYLGRFPYASSASEAFCWNTRTTWTTVGAGCHGPRSRTC